MRSPPKEKLRTRDEAGEETLEPALFHCAEIILPWLNPAELASVSSTCRTLRRISKSITVERAADASRSFESLPIPFINTVDCRPYAFFIYSPSQVIASSSPLSQRQSWGLRSRSNPGRFVLDRGHCDGLVSEMGYSGLGCGCERCDSEVEDRALVCPCASLDSSEMMTECGPGCWCGSDCKNRVTQKGISVRLKIVRDSKKGWGLYADQVILSGQFVCEYAGELLTTTEARRRQQLYDEAASFGQCSSALLVVKEHLPSGRACMRINIDATRVGNVARFINHSCDGGNLSTRLVRSSGVLLPRLCFFAATEIRENEELTFSYGVDRIRLNGLPCFCGSSCCFGVLPSENT